jgi:hypothetical protein
MSSKYARAALALSLVVTASAALGSLSGCRRWRSHATYLKRSIAARDPNALGVPHVAQSIKVDGILDEEPWRTTVLRSGVLVAADGSPGRPYSDARVFWSGDALYLGLYAADGDLRGSDATAIGDAFHVEISRGKEIYALDIDVAGALEERARRSGIADALWKSGARIGHDTDGTVKPRSGGPAPKREHDDEGEDADEEWVLEVAIPLASIGVQPRKGETFGLVVRRCDVSAASDAPNAAVLTHPCATWGSAARPKVLTLE